MSNDHPKIECKVRSPFKVATFNVNSIRSRLPVLMEWVHENQPDVLCLQETKVEDKDFPVSAFEDASYSVVFWGEKRWNGVAIASKVPAHSVEYGFCSAEPTEESRMISAVCSGITVINTYVPQGRAVDDAQFSYKINWVNRFIKELLEVKYSPQQPLLWCGDLNHAPEAIDVYDPKTLRGHVCFHPEVEKVFQRIIAWGFVDVFRKHCPEPGQYSFYDYRIPNAVKRGLGWRLDHILATRPLAERSKGSNIDLTPRLKPKPSDHAIVVAEFML